MIEIKGKEIVTIASILCLTILIAMGKDNLLLNLFVAILVIYNGVDRYWTKIRKRGG